MQIGIIGLGRMGGNIVRRLMKHGHEPVVYDREPKAVMALTFAEKVLSAMRKGFGGHLEPKADRS